MFCSKCGKTLPSDSQRCPSCGQEVGESRFDGVPYTAAQFRISPDGTTGRSRDAKAYTKITYTDMQDPLKNEADSDARTSYRPVYEGSSVPEEIRGDVRRAMGVEEDVSPGEGTPSYGDSPESERVRELFGDAGEEQGLDDFDLSQLRSRPIVSEGRAGISRDVAEYVEKLENSEKGTRRGRRRAVYGAEEYDVPPQIDEPAGASYDEAPVDEAGDEPYARSRFPVRTVVKIVIAVLIIAALAMGVKLLYDNVTAIRKSASPIEGVSQTLYDEGVQLIEAHQNNEYTMSLLQKFSTDGLVAVTGQLAQDQAAVAALAPAEPAVNDELFLSVLTSIQENIGNAVTMDVLALSQADTAAAQAESDARWQIVRDSVAQLKSAKTAGELTAILGGEKISIATPTP